MALSYATRDLGTALAAAASRYFPDCNLYIYTLPGTFEAEVAGVYVSCRTHKMKDARVSHDFMVPEVAQVVEAVMKNPGCAATRGLQSQGKTGMYDPPWSPQAFVVGAK